MRPGKVGIACMMVIVISGCSGDDGSTSGPTVQRTPPFTPEPSAAMRLAIATEFPGAQSVADIGGYNDVQALQKAGAATDYGPLASLYVAPVAYTDADYLHPNKPVVALIEVAGDPSGTGSPAAYAALKLTPAPDARIYCVYLTYRQTGGGKNWDGYVAPINGNICPDEPAENTRLRADQLVDPNYNSQTDYPYTARWVDTQNDLPTIGVSCGVAFCTIGRGTADNGNPNGNSGLRGKDLKPWHDDQKLAIPPSSGSGPLTRSARAIVAPVPGLDQIRKNDFASGVKVGTVTMTEMPAQKYLDWGLVAGENDIYVKMIDDATNEWAAQFVAAGDAPTADWPIIVYRTDHPGGPTVPGTMRWIWHPEDEEIWLGCDQGCCVISHGFTKKRNPPGPPPGTKQP